MNDGPHPPATVHRKQYGPRATMNLDELERARTVVTYNARAVANYSDALVGEVVARDWVASAYKGPAKLRAVMIRPGGVPVLDYLFETGRGEFVVVEAKAANAQLGWTNGRILMVEPGGGIYVLNIPGDVQQFSPTWFQQRLDEMTGPKGDPLSRRLAAELDESWQAGKIRALLIRAPEGARTTEVAMEVLDHSDEWNAHVGATATHTIPAGTEVGAVVSGAPVKKGVSEQRPTANRVLAINEADEKRLKKELDRLDGERAKTEKALKRAKGRLQTAEKTKIDKEKKPGTWQSTKDDLAEKVTARKAEVARLEANAAKAREAVGDVKQSLTEVRQRLRESRAEVRRLRSGAGSAGAPMAAAAHAAASAEPGSVKGGRATESPAVEAPAGAQPEAIKAGRATNNPSIASKATEIAATRAKAVSEGEQLSRALAHGADSAKIGKLARVVSLSKNIGKITIGLFLPLTKLEIVLELALWLYDWDQRRRQADDREWSRIYSFLFRSATPVADPFSISYLPAIGGSIWDEMNGRLDNERHPQNFLYWLFEWDKNPNWLGFVYVRVAGDLTRQVHVPRQSSAPKAPHPIRYWALGGLGFEFNLEFKTWSTEGNRWKKEGPTKELRPEDSENLFTLGKLGDPYNKPENQGPTPSGAATSLRSDYLYRDVESTRISVRVTSPTPILTPFDYLIFKCKDLMVEVLRFISRFDEYFHIMHPFDRDNIFTIYWYEDVKFPDPIDSAAAHYCIKRLFAFVQLLETHTPRDASESAQSGWERRQQIIASLVPRNRTRIELDDIANKLHFLASDLNYAAYRLNQDPELAYLTNEHLEILAIDIKKSAQRIYNDMMAGKESPRSHQYKYMGSKDD